MDIARKFSEATSEAIPAPFLIFIDAEIFSHENIIIYPIELFMAASQIQECWSFHSQRVEQSTF